ncbi:MAG: NAD(P)-dependent oxidoreductase [Armatimonadetes bacterium]|nr:NAD(P)-dependent oxidoreductase [Armatimonadota bacterium]
MSDIGFIGAGAMGRPMALNLLQAGHRVTVYDLNPEAIAACVEHGASPAASAADAVRGKEFILTSLRSSDAFVSVADVSLVPAARAEQVFIDLGTTRIRETRRVGQALLARGAHLLDAPVSGGPEGARTGMLRIFVGGDAGVYRRALPVLEVLGDPDRIRLCGPIGSGQIVKGTNQLAMALGAAAWLEAASFATRAGVSPQAILDTVGGDCGWRGEFADVVRRISAGDGDHVDTKLPELPYFLEFAEDAGLPMPLTRALWDLCAEGDWSLHDNMHRATASYWRELHRATHSRRLDGIGGR